MLRASAPPLQARGLPWLFISVQAGIAALFVGELILGTEFTFALEMTAIMTITACTLRALGTGSLPGILLGMMIFSFVGFSQIAKIVLGQPAHTNLAAPDVTAGVLLIGTLSLCGGALLVDHLLKGRKLHERDFTIDQMVGLRNLSFLVGGICTTIASRNAGGGISEYQFGGIAAVALEFSSFSILALMTDCWVALMRSNGQRSTSPTVLAQLGGLTILGFLLNSKQGIATPLIAYWLASYSYRHRITARQVYFAIFALVFGICVIYPANQLIRGLAANNASVAARAEILLEQFIDDPMSVALDWEIYTSTPIEKMSLHEQGLNYLGSMDDLAGRFLLIANTDVIVNAVEEKGPFGMGLVTQGFLVAVPTLLMPDKPRIDTGDLLTWFYGIRKDDGEVGFPTIGLFADCYAAGLWPGIVILPFLMMLGYLPTLQFYGRSISGNIITAYLLINHLQIFIEGALQDFVGYSIRSLPFEMLKIYILIYLANRYFTPRRQARAG